MDELLELEEVDLRSIWKNESYDFTPWLAKEENIHYIGDLLGIDIIDIKTEQKIGAFSCDIVASDETTGDKVIIENQIEQSNHEHLGKLVTYASGVNAKYVVWVVKEAREEHSSAIEWLNNNSISGINFFLIEVHVYKIGESNPAPKFNIIEKPNDFIKRNKQIDNNELNNSQQERLIFWEQFVNYIKQNNIKDINIRKASSDHWYNVAVGTSKCHISITLVGKENHIGVELYINDDKALYDKLELKKDEIEKNTGLHYEWMRLDDGKASRIKMRIEGLDFNNHTNYNGLIIKIIDVVKKMKKEFQAQLKQILE